MIAVWYMEELSAQDTKRCVLKVEPMKMWSQGRANEDVLGLLLILGREKNLSVL